MFVSMRCDVHCCSGGCGKSAEKNGPIRSYCNPPCDRKRTPQVTELLEEQQWCVWVAVAVCLGGGGGGGVDCCCGSLCAWVGSGVFRWGISRKSCLTHLAKMCKTQDLFFGLRNNLVYNRGVSQTYRMGILKVRKTHTFLGRILQTYRNGLMDPEPFSNFNWLCGEKAAKFIFLKT